MVYRGKPSKGCEACRKRKKRCDLAPEGCYNCQKAHRTCPGYRDLSEVLFLNESADVVRKARARSGPESSASAILTPSEVENSATHSGRGGSDENRMLPYAGPSLSMNFTHGLSTSPAERAMGFFTTHFVLRRSSHELDRHLLDCMQTVGLASLAGVVRDPSLMKEARHKYIEAIRSTNLALSSAKDSVKDSSLLAIILLTVFETLSSPSFEAWTKHVNGTVALIKLRGPEQLLTVQGARLFMQASHALISKCALLGLSLPQDLLSLDAEAAKYADPKDPTWRMHVVMVALTNLRAAWNAENRKDLRSLLAEALELDREAQMIFAEATSSWDYEVIRTDDPDYAHTGCYHVYPHYMAAQTWNGMRGVRIVLNAMIRRILLHGFSTVPPVFRKQEHTTQCQISTDIVFELQLDIIASAFQHLGQIPRQRRILGTLGEIEPASAYIFPWTYFDNPLAHNPFHLGSSSQAGNLPMIRNQGGYSFPWTIYTAGATDGATNTCRDWAIATLRTIGDSMAIQSAFALAEKLCAQRRGGT